MENAQWLDIINFGLVILIWLVQLVIYPSFMHVSKAEFRGWHKKYVERISSVVIPLMLVQMILIVRLVVTQPRISHCLMLSGLIIIWISSFSLAVPFHKVLQNRGKDKEVIKRLVQTNWIRTILWTAVFLTGLIK